MDNDEILMRMKKHYIFFQSLEGKVSDDILEQCKIYGITVLDLLRENLRVKL